MTSWTEYASIVALGIGANSENLPVGLGYGMQGRKIALASNLFIAAVTTAATLVPLDIGERLRGYMPVQFFSGASVVRFPRGRATLISGGPAWLTERAIKKRGR
jgi:hypothetical protein